MFSSRDEGSNQRNHFALKHCSSSCYQQDFLIIISKWFRKSVRVTPLFPKSVINSRTAIAGAIIGLLGFLQFKEFELYWRAVF